MYAQADLRHCWFHLPHCLKSHAAAQMYLKLVNVLNVLSQLTLPDMEHHIEDNRKPITDLSDVWNASSYYICTNLEVISMLGRCDNSTDCTDGSDELNCPELQGTYLDSICLKSPLNPFRARGNFFRLLITFVNSVVPDKLQLFVGPDLHSNCLTLKVLLIFC